MSEFRHCQHTFPDGHTCGSAAVTGRDYCYHHLSHRGRRIRMARARSEQRRIYLDLPSLDSLSAIHAAATQIVEALAADVIDVRNAQAILSGLRFLSRTIAKAETAAWHNNIYQNDQPQSCDSFESDFGLPANFDINTPLELAYSPPENPQGVILSEGGALYAPPKSKDPFVSVYRMGTAQTATNNLPDPPSMPYSGNYCADHQSTECDCMLIRADFPVTPESVEIIDVSETLGSDAAALRARQLERNRQRRQLRTDRKRYAARAQELNIRRAADILAQRKLVTQSAQAQASESVVAMKKPPAASSVATQPDLEEVQSTA
jgi:hypothetical protein